MRLAAILAAVFSLSGCIRALPSEAFVDMRQSLIKETKPELFYLVGSDNTKSILSKLQMCNAELANQYNDKSTARTKIENYK